MTYASQWKCPVCGWVHIGISKEEAEEQVALANAYLATLNLEQEGLAGQVYVALERYLHCFRCNAPSRDFVPAEPGDAPPLATLPAVIAPIIQPE